tara:strand:- start:53932 stop:54075 length:144 start_codon:yes stop_codon:yes gene_type:complete
MLSRLEGVAAGDTKTLSPAYVKPLWPEIMALGAIPARLDILAMSFWT